MQLCTPMEQINRTRFITSFLMVLFILSGCSMHADYGRLSNQADDAYRVGNYDGAVRFSSRALMIKPDDAANQKILTSAYPLSTQIRMRTIQKLRSKKELQAKDALVDEYQTLIEIDDLVRTLPPLINMQTQLEIKLPLEDKHAELSEVKQGAAEAYYQYGHEMTLLAGAENSKAAAKAFKKAQFYISGYKDADELYEKYRTAATKRIAIFPFSNNSGLSQYDKVASLVAEQLTETVLESDWALEFVNVVSVSELEDVMKQKNFLLSEPLDEKMATQLAASLGADEIILGEITQIKTSEPQQTIEHNEEAAIVVVGEQHTVNDDGLIVSRDIYDEVSANVIKNTVYANAEITGAYKIVAVKSAKPNKQAALTGVYHYQGEWVSYQGDKRALSSYSRRLLDNQPAVSPKVKERVGYAAKDLVSILSDSIRTYVE